MNLDKANIPDFGVIAVLGLALLMAVFYRMNELAMSIASGLRIFRWIGEIDTP